METRPPHLPVGLTVTPASSPIQCPYCATMMLFLGCTSSEQCAEWICPACRTMKIRPMALLQAFADVSTSAGSVLPEPRSP